MNITPETLLSEASELKETLIENRRFLHSHPETGFDLHHTKDYVKNALISMGYEPIECGKCGLLALAGGKHKGKTFLLRADMDALKITEQADVDFPSEIPGNMHACGHDLHTAMLLGAAKLLKLHEDEIQGTIKLFFQPSEETFEGAADMIANGALENPHVDAALMIHVMAGMPMPAGTVIVCDGGVSAPAADYFQISIQGKGCHGAMPQAGVDPITIAAHTVTALQELHARELAMSDEAALTFGYLQAGQAENVIPDTANLGGTLRTYDEELRNTLKVRMQEICEGTAKIFRGTAKLTFSSGCPTLFNDAALSEQVTSYCKELLGTERAFSTAQLKAMSPNAASSKTVGSEDFAYVSHEVPTIMLALAAGEPKNGYCYPQHHPMVKFDESVLVPGSCVYAYTAMRWLEE